MDRAIVGMSGLVLRPDFVTQSAAEETPLPPEVKH
jgi:hypothetical protein